MNHDGGATPGRREQLLTIHGVGRWNVNGTFIGLIATLLILLVSMLLITALLFGISSITTAWTVLILMIASITIILSLTPRSGRSDAELYRNGILLPVPRRHGGERFVTRDSIERIELSRGRPGYRPPSGRDWAMLNVVTLDDRVYGTGWKEGDDVARAADLIRSEWGIGAREV